MQIGLGIGTTFRRKWVPPLTEQIRSLLFGSGQQGAWYDPSDMSTLFQDEAGTIPVTAVEQPVGRMLDKSGRGNHATQATTTKRPVLSRRVNLALATEDASSAKWMPPINATVAAASAVGAPLVSALWAVTETATSAVHVVGMTLLGVVSGGTYTISYIVKAGARTWARIFEDTAGSFAYFNLSTGEIGTTTNATANIVSLGNGFYRCSMTYAQSGTVLRARIAPALNNGVVVYAGDGGIGLYVSGLQIEPGPLTSYQRVNTATDYDADPAKFPAYLRFDGVDDAMQTGNIDFTSTNKMTVWAGVQEFNTSVGMICEFTANAGNIPQSFYLAVKDTGGGTSSFSARGLTIASIGRRSVSNPLLASGAADLSIPSVVARFNQTSTGNTVIVGSTAAGFANAPLYVGARAGTSLFFNGRIYSLIVRGAQSSLSQIEATEVHIKQKMRLP